MLETGWVYIVPLMESLELPRTSRPRRIPRARPGGSTSSPASSRIAARNSTRSQPAIADALFLEISPRTFPVLVRAGSRLTQMRFRCRWHNTFRRPNSISCTRPRRQVASERPQHLGRRQSRCRSTCRANAEGLFGLPGQAAHRPDRRRQAAAHDVLDYWEPIRVRGRHELILDPNEFTSWCRAKAVHVPPGHAAEMTPLRPAGGRVSRPLRRFFDPGFGHSAPGARAAAPSWRCAPRGAFILEHGQIGGRLVYDAMAARPKAPLMEHISSRTIRRRG